MRHCARFRRLLIGFGVWGAGILQAAEPSRLPDVPRSIIIPSGVPLVVPAAPVPVRGHKGIFEAAPKADQSGGFGDIAANISMAMRFKERLGPDTPIRLVVTLNDDDPRPGINKVRNVVPTLLPGLNPDNPEMQLYKGVEVYFLNIPNESYTQLDARSRKLASKIPESDLAVQFSANHSEAWPVLHRGQLRLSFLEFSGKGGYQVLDGLNPGHDAELMLNSGPFNLGIYDPPPDRSAAAIAQRKSEITGLLRERLAGQDALKDVLSRFPTENSEIGFAYTSQPHLREAYHQAVGRLAAKNPKQSYIVFYKQTEAGEVPRLARGRPNLLLVPLPSFSRSAGDALITEATLSPLITGNNSLSTALVSVRPDKAFFLENNEWGQALSAAMTREFKAASKGDQLDFGRLVLDPAAGQRKLSRQIEAGLLDKETPRLLAEVVSKRRGKMDLVDNTLNSYRMLRDFSANLKEVGTDADDNFLNWVVHAYAETRVGENPETVLRKALSDSPHVLEKWYATMALLTRGDPLSAVERAKALKTLEAMYGPAFNNLLMPSSVHVGKNADFQSLILEGLEHPEPKIRAACLGFVRDYGAFHDNSLHRLVSAARWSSDLCAEAYRKLRLEAE